MWVGLEAYLGHAAGIATSLLWTATSLFFTAAARRLGTTVLNATRIALAVVLLGVTHRLFAGHWLPDANAEQVLLLALSGLIGLTIGDQALFKSFVEIGPRTAMLIMTTSPLWAALLGWLVLGETLHAIAWFGVSLTVGGVAWVVLERPPPEAVSAGRRRFQGCALAFIAAVCQAAGLLLSKRGMGHGWLPTDHHLPPQTATFIRMVFAGVGMVPVVIWHVRRRQRRRNDSRLPDGSRSVGLLLTCGGAIVGPYLGVWMSLVATDRAPLGIAQTLCSMSPIFLLPFAAVIQKERISTRAILGAVIAVAGSALLFFQTG